MKDTKPSATANDNTNDNNNIVIEAFSIGDYLYV